MAEVPEVETVVRDLRGTQLQHRQIFERAGQSCPRCGTPIARLRQNNRNMFAVWIRTYARWLDRS